ncbi:MAG: hypothetical protein ABI175_05885, partial [Polyangiales bacterium]
MLAQTALASLAALGTCAGLPAGNMKDPHYWGDYMLDKYEAERQVPAHLEPGPAPLAHPRTVLLITGVTIPAVWFDPIKARLVRDGFRPVVYEPPALLSGDLFENSEALATVIDGIRAQTGEKKIDILAECTGGLIARHYIQSLGGDEHVSRLVTFISPQHGLPKAPLAANVAGWPALYDLSPGSGFLETVNSAALPANIPVTSIYTQTDEYIQPYETSIIPGAKNVAVGEDELVGHFQFFYDPKLYLIMHAALTAPAPSDNDPAPPDPTTPGQPDDMDEMGPDD